MRTYFRPTLHIELVAGVLGPFLLAGCGNAITPLQTGDSRASLSSVVLDEPPDVVDDTSGVFRNVAESVLLDEMPWHIQGVLTGPDDVDLYEIGPVNSGDRVVVTFSSTGSLNGAIALFDASGASLLINDHQNVYLGKTQPFIDVVFPYAQPATYVAVSLTPGFDSAGNYSLEASKEPGYILRELRPDVAILDFSGVNGVRISSRPPIDMTPFDASDISPNYQGYTEEMIRSIVEQVRYDYEAFDVTILSTSEGDVWEPGVTRLFFGAYDAALLGVAEGVDEFNATDNQQAIVFTDSFVAFTPLSPSATQMGQAIANVASHEIGHLMGMVHTDDSLGIMDVTASLRELLEDQSFRRSLIYSSVFPIGFQDAPNYLLASVGGDAQLAMEKAQREDLRKVSAMRDDRRQPARKASHLSLCALERQEN